MKIFTSLTLLTVVLTGGLLWEQSAVSQPANPFLEDPQLAARTGDTARGGQPVTQKTKGADSPARSTAAPPAPGGRNQANRRANAVLDTARGLLEGQIQGQFGGKPRFIRAYKAEIVQRTHFGGHFFSAHGLYAQQNDHIEERQKNDSSGRYRRFALKRRLELTIRHGLGKDQSTDYLLQVCDGEILKTLKIVNDVPFVTRRNVGDILRAARLATREEASGSRLQEEAGRRKQLLLSLGLGGISGLIAGLQTSMVFDTFRVNDDRSYELGGTWNADFTNRWRSLTRKESFPPHVPDRVRVVIDSNFLVRKIEYLKQQADGEGFVPMVSIAFLKIEVDPQLPPQMFQFTAPENAPEQDRTNQYLRLFKRQNQQ